MNRYHRLNTSNGRLLRPITAAVVGVLVFLLWRALQYSGAENTNNSILKSEEASNPSERSVSENRNVAVSANTATNSDVREKTNVNSAVGAQSTNVAQPAVTTSTPCVGVVSSFGSDPSIALTFDAGSSTGSAADIADILVETHTPGSFFVTGKWIEKNRDIAQSLVKDGFALYNHSYSHPHPNAITDEELKAELEKTEELITSVGAADPKPYFRPPYGEYTDAVVATARRVGYCLVLWTVDALDWQAGATPSASKERVLSKAKNGAIVLLHVGDDIVPKFLPDLIAELRIKGFTMVTLADLMQAK